MEAIGAATSGLREYSTDESLWSTISTELDLSFGVAGGLGGRVERQKARAIPASVRERKPRGAAKAQRSIE